PSTTEIYTLSLHDALPISHAVPGQMLGLEVEMHEALRAADVPARLMVGRQQAQAVGRALAVGYVAPVRREAAFEVDRHRVMAGRSEEHTSELQSRRDLVCR